MADKTKKDRNFTAYADKPPTDLQTRFSVWILEKTGYEPEDMDSFTEGVRLATALRMAFQASDENQKALEERREELAAAKAARAAKPAKAKAVKAKAKANVEPEPEDEPEDDADEDEDQAPVERKQPVRRRKAKDVEPEPEADEDEDTEAPF